MTEQTVCVLLWAGSSNLQTLKDLDRKTKFLMKSKMLFLGSILSIQDIAQQVSSDLAMGRTSKESRFSIPSIGKGLFSKVFRPALGPTPTSCSTGPKRSFPRGKASRL